MFRYDTPNMILHKELKLIYIFTPREWEQEIILSEKFV